MKQQFRKHLKAYLRAEFLKNRADLNITQEEMAHRLLMSSRAYANIESGKSCRSLITALLFLSRCCLDRQDFLDGLSNIFAPAETDIR